MTQVVLVDNEVDRIVFHYNKAHNTDQTIPQWVIKHKGKSYYVNHIESAVGFVTKETPDNEHTKGSILFRGRLIITDDQNGKVKASIY